MKIYGVDTSKKVTPIMARDAIVECFTKAHQESLDEMIREDIHDKKNIDRLKKMKIRFIIEAKFAEVGDDFNQPTKVGVIRVMDALAEYASNFRNDMIIKKHHDEIMKIVKLM